MYYAILQYIFMVYVCNLKASANTIRHKTNPNIDIDDFINQLLVSRKFDELAEKVADKAAKKIQGIDKPNLRIERFSATNNDTLQEGYKDISNKDFEAYENINLENQNPQSSKLGKIDTEAIMRPGAEQSENLRLKYKYLTKTAYEKKLFQERPPDNTQNNDAHKYENTVASKQKQKPEKKTLKKKQQKQIGMNTEGHYNQDGREEKPNLYEEGSPSRYKIKNKENDPQRDAHEFRIEADNRNAENANIQEHSLENGPRRLPGKNTELMGDRPVFKSSDKMEIIEKAQQTKEASSTEEDLKELEKLGSDNHSFEKSREEDRGKRYSREEDRGKRYSREEDGKKRYGRPEDEKKRYSREEDVGKRYSREEDVGKRYSREEDVGKRYSREEDVGKRYSREEDGGKRYSREEDGGKRYSREEDRGKRDSREESGNSERSERSEQSERSEKSEEAVLDNTPMFRSHDKKVPNVEDNKVTSDYQNPEEVPEEVPEELLIQSTNKPVLRKEGNKVYAIPVATDYEEYHEQYAKIQKTKENPNKFPIL